MLQNWMLVIDVALLALLLTVSTVIKSKFAFVKKFPIPIPVIAGFLGLLVGQEAFNLIQLDHIRMEGLVYHLMSIGFIPNSAIFLRIGKLYFKSIFFLFIQSSIAIFGGNLPPALRPNCI